MAYKWVFKRATPGDRARESQVEKFFTSNAVKNRANGMVREGIQNSLDAAPGNEPVLVRIKIGECDRHESSRLRSKYGAGLGEHLEAEGVKNRIHNLPAPDEVLRYLVFEDFGTSGLKGDPAEWWPDEHGRSGAFFNFFRAEGISGKSDGARGRHGVGRLVFMFASRTRSMWGLTIRPTEGAEDRQLLMGTAVLRNHRVDNLPFLPDGWFGRDSSDVQGLTLPIEDPSYLGDFKKDFGLHRDARPGLSIVVPWLESDVSATSIVESMLSEYYYPILTGKLSVEVEGESGEVVSIGRDSLESIVSEQDHHFRERLAPIISLAKDFLAQQSFVEIISLAGGALKWSKDVVSETTAKTIAAAFENNERVFLRVSVGVRPRDRAQEPSGFFISLEKAGEIGESVVHFIREGIIISDVRPRRTSGIRAIVVVERGALATFLGDAENPSHTEWQKDLVKDGYVHAVSQLDYVVQCVPMLLSLISSYQSKPDATLLLDLFSVPASSGVKRPTAEPKSSKGTDSHPPDVDAERKPASYRIKKTSNGFSVSHGDSDAATPAALVVKMAYAVRRGNPFSKFSPSDFQIGKDGVTVDAHGCTINSQGHNWLVLTVNQSDFEISLSGFDVSLRDLRVDVQARGQMVLGNSPGGAANA